MTAEAGQRELRGAYRAWVRACHPDVGGDVDAFVAGLARWRRRIGSSGAAPVVVYRRPRGPVSFLVAWCARRRRRRQRAATLR